MLWQDLRFGMTIDEAASALRTIEGIKSAQVRTSRKGKKSLKIAYTKSGFQIADLPSTISLGFDADRLQEVTINNEACLSLSVEKFKSLQSLLAEKYGEGKVQREVTEDQQFVGMRSTHANFPTRAMLRLEPIYPPVGTPAPYGSGALGELASALSHSMADAAIDACPNDQGVKGGLSITYLHNASTLEKEEQQRKQDELKRQQDKDKL